MSESGDDETCIEHRQRSDSKDETINRKEKCTRRPSTRTGIILLKFEYSTIPKR